MKKLFPHMYDSPEPAQALGALSYGLFPFLILPFTLMLFVIGVTDTRPFVILEFLFQAINFIALAAIFHTYLRDSWLNVTIAPKGVLTVSLSAAVLIAAIYLESFYAGFRQVYDRADTVFFGILPMTGIELMMLPGDFALDGGIPAVLLLVFLGPVITACMFYAPTFAPLCVRGHRLLGYLSVAALLAVPRIVTYFTVWGGWKEVELYLAQLPIHLLACWTYQKTDTVWAPIFTHAIANALCCAALYGLHHAGIIH